MSQILNPYLTATPCIPTAALIVTRHISGSFEQCFDRGADILLRHAEQIRHREPLLNVVDPTRGY